MFRIRKNTIGGRLFSRLSSARMMPVWFILILVTIMVAVWYSSGRLVYFWDQTFPLNPPRAFQALLHVWHPEYDFGRIDVTAIAFIPYVGLIALFYYLTSSLIVAQAIYFWLLLAVAGIGFYKFSLLLLKNYYRHIRWRHIIASLIAALFYLFNPYVIFYLWRIPNTYAMLYAILPVLITVITEYVNIGKKRYVCLAVMCSIMMSPGLSNPSLLPVMIIVPLFAIFLSKQSIKKSIIRILTLGVICVAAMSFWLIPVVMNVGSVASAGSYGGVKEALQQNSLNLQVSNTMRLLGESPITETLRGERDYTWADWYRADIHPILSIIPFLPLLCTLIALGLGRNTSRKLTLFTAIVLLLFIVFVFFAKGSAFPFSKLFMLLFDNVSAFTMFRDPFPKFGLGVLYLLATLFTLSLPVVFSLCTAKFIRVSVMVALGIIVVGYGLPLLTGNVFRPESAIRTAARVKIPSDYKQVSDIITAESTSGQRLLSMPREPYPLMSEKWESGYVGYDPMRLLTLRPVISTANNDPKQIQFASVLYDDISSKDKISTMRLANVGVKWILLRKKSNVAFNEVKFDYKEVQEKFSKTKTLSKVFDGPYLSLYRVEGTTKDYYIPKNIVESNISSDPTKISQSLSTVSNTISISPGEAVGRPLQTDVKIEYKGNDILLRNISGTTIIASHEAFNANWVLVAGKVRIKPVTINAMQTGWIVDSEVICNQNNSCDQNLDGSRTMRLKLDFVLQRQEDIGKIISIVVGGSALMYYLVDSFRRGYRRYIVGDAPRKIAPLH